MSLPRSPSTLPAPALNLPGYSKTPGACHGQLPAWLFGFASVVCLIGGLILVRRLRGLDPFAAAIMLTMTALIVGGFAVQGYRQTIPVSAGTGPGQPGFGRYRSDPAGREPLSRALPAMPRPRRRRRRDRRSGAHPFRIEPARPTHAEPDATAISTGRSPTASRHRDACL